MDFFEYGEFVYIVSAQSFEVLTDVRKVTFDKAMQVIGKVGSKPTIGIGDSGGLVAQIAKKPLWSKKIASAEKLGTVDALTAENMIARITKKGLKITFEKKDGKTVFSIDNHDAAALRDFVELITDTYLSSEVTGIEYKTFSKGRAKS